VISAIKATEKSSAAQNQIVEFVALRKRYNELAKEAAVTHYNLGVLYMGQGQRREAAEEFEYALLLNPNDPLAHYNLGILYGTYLSQPQKALAGYKEYLRLLPSAKDSQQVEERIRQLSSVSASKN